MNKCEEIKKEKAELLESNSNLNELIDLDEITKGYKIFTNIDSLRHEKAFEFFSKLSESLVKNNNKLLIPLKGIRIMEDNSDSLDLEEGLEWKKGIDILKNIQENGVLDVRGEETDGHLNNLIQYVFAKHRISNNLLLLTQNENLAYDILELNKSRTVRGNKIEVYKINGKGNAERFETNS
ncbi:hypothetical protein [uncultured Clostridium sp.]|uniref:hypothetical protein n=1 Tax=uncultured Clostridium sp. TaxID=59620 RepID=UPI00260519C8|nr:hypothetical protein [uncultured Clostridium sp.]